VQQIVVDTNVLVAALRSKRGASHRLVQMIGAGKFQANISVALALEYEDVLKRSGLLPDMRAADVNDFLDYIFKSSALVPFVLPRRPVLRDPGDESILEVAVECHAIIVTHNKRDFAGAERFGISVLTPGEFLRTIEENP
jgi:putative PIN family toxin of toxin-antitoxin system